MYLTKSITSTHDQDRNYLWVFVSTFILEIWCVFYTYRHILFYWASLYCALHSYCFFGVGFVSEWRFVATSGKQIWWHFFQQFTHLLCLSRFGTSHMAFSFQWYLLQWSVMDDLGCYSSRSPKAPDDAWHFFLSSIFTLRYVHLGIHHGTLYRLQFTVSLTFCALGNQKVMWPALLGYLLYCDVCLIVIFALLRWSETEPATSNVPEGCLYSAPPFGTATCHVPNRHKWLASTTESEAERGPTLGATSWFSHLLSVWPFWFPVFIWKITL